MQTEEMDLEAAFAEVVAERKERTKAVAEPKVRGIQIGKLDGRFLFRLFRWPNARFTASVELWALGFHLWATFAVRRRLKFDKARAFYQPRAGVFPATAAVMLFGHRFGVTYSLGRYFRVSA